MKIIKWLMVFLMSLTIGLNFVKAEAKTLTMEQVRAKLEEKLKQEDGLISLDEGIELKVILQDSSKMEVKLIKGEEEKVLCEFTIADDVLTLERTFKVNDLTERANVGENPSVDINSDDFDSVLDAITLLMVDNYVYSELIMTVAELKEYNERDIRDFVDLKKATFASDGYEYKTEEKQEQQETKYIYKIDINKFKLNPVYTEDAAPKIELVDITDKQIGIKLSGVEEDNTMVEVYRSEDGENYTWWQTVSAMKDGSVTYFDDSLKANTKYYYKAAVLKSSKFSGFVSTTTLEKAVEDNTIKDDADKPAESPQTGFNDYLILGALGASGIILTSYILKNKQKFYKI